MTDVMLLTAVVGAVVGATWGLVRGLTHKPTNDTSWRKEPTFSGEIKYEHTGVDHLGRKEPTL
jgi:hypothetical protein